MKATPFTSTLTRCIRRLAVIFVLIGTIGTGLATRAEAELVLGTTNLSRVYKANDGSLLYTAAAGGKVVGLAEKWDAVSFVFEGTWNGSTITGRWWDMPEVNRTQTGSITLSIGGNGASLTRTGGSDPGPDSWTAVSKTEAGYLSLRAPAQWQEEVAGDIDGAFDSTDGSRAYGREAAGDVVLITKVLKSGQLPTAITAYIGKRVSPNQITGTFYDLAIGERQKSGTFTATEGANRTLTVQTKVGTQLIGYVFYTPDYAVDFDRFVTEIHKRFDGNAVGYSFAIAHDGNVQRTGAWGVRSVPQEGDSPLEPSPPFQDETQNGIASSSKTVTAVALARALEQKHLGLDAKVDPYLPAQWTRGEGMKDVTFRQLLHHDGLKHPGAICDTDPYGCLKESVKLGMTAEPGYNNIHYALIRVILPFVVDKAKMTELFASHDVNKDGAALNEAFSKEFRSYVLGMLTGENITADFAFTSSNVANGYDFGGTNERITTDSGDDYLGAGPGGMKGTSRQYAKFLSRFDEGKFVSPSMVRALKDGSLGFDQLNGPWDSDALPALGTMHSKSGGAKGRSSQIFIGPSGVQVFWTGVGYNPDAGSRAQLIRMAYEASLV